MARLIIGLAQVLYFLSLHRSRERYILGGG